MRRSKCLMLLLGYGGIVLAQTSTQDIVQRSMQARTEMIESLKAGVVRVEAEGEIGTGMVLSATPEKIQILTALHVVKDAKKVNVVFYSDRSTRVPAKKGEKFSKSLDLAVLELVATAGIRLPSDIRPFRFATINDVDPAAHVYSVNEDWIVAQNGLTKLDHDFDPQFFEYTNRSNTVGEGFSGGPVFDDYGDVIGMHKAMSPEYSVAVRIDIALQALAALRYTVPKAGPIALPGFSQPTQPGSKEPMKLARITANLTYQPAGLPSGQVTLMLTPNAGDATYTASLMGSFYATFTNGTVSADGLTFNFNSLYQGGKVMVSMGNRYLTATSGSLSVTIDHSLNSGTGMASGSLSGSVKLAGTAFEARQPGVGYGRAPRPGQGGTTAEVSAQLAGTYQAVLMTKDVAAATAASLPSPVQSQVPAMPGNPSMTAPGGNRSQADPCARGCKAAIGSLKQVARYQYAHGTYASLRCEEKVFALPEDWPGLRYLHSVVCNGPNARGEPVTLINFRLAETEREKDQDVAILYTDTGVGSFRGTDGRHWRVKIYGGPALESMTIDMTPR